MRVALPVVAALVALTSVGPPALRAAEPAVVGPNLVVSGGFEQGLEGWGGGGKITTAHKTEGKQAVCLDAGTRYWEGQLATGPNATSRTAAPSSRP